MRNLFSCIILVGLVWVVLPLKLKGGQLETVLSNERVLSNYIKCLLDNGPCTPEGQELKSKIIIPSQYLIDFCTFFAHSFPPKKFRHFFTFKRYMLFWAYDTVSDLFHFITIILSDSFLMILLQFKAIFLKFNKTMLLLFFDVFQDICPMLYSRIARNAAHPRSATPEK